MMLQKEALLNAQCHGTLVIKIPYYSIYNCLMIKVNSKFPIKITAFKKPDRNEKIIKKHDGVGKKLLTW